MPTYIGSFLSRHVYDDHLVTEHTVEDKECCRFIDVEHGREEKSGNTCRVCCPFTTCASYRSSYKKLHLRMKQRPKPSCTLSADSHRKASVSVSSLPTTASAYFSSKLSRVKIFHGRISASAWIVSKVRLYSDSSRSRADFLRQVTKMITLSFLSSSQRKPDSSTAITGPMSC